MPVSLEDAVIRKEVLRDKIFEILKGWILDGTMKPGERLVELLIAKKLQVSRAPLREALWLLSLHGLVTIRPHQGAFVTRLSDQDIREIFEVREVLEAYAAKKAAASLTGQTRARLKEALALLETATLSREIAKFTEADLRFHQILWTLSGNSQLEEILLHVATRFFGYELIQDLHNVPVFRFDEMYEEHRRMVDLILEGSPERIEAGFHSSFCTFLDYVLSRFGEHAQEARDHRP